MNTRRRRPILLALTFVLAACGGASGSPGGGTSAPGQPTGTTSTSGPASAPPGGGAGGDGGAGATIDACSLLTVPEALGAEQIPSDKTLKTTSDDEGICTFVMADDFPALELRVLETGGKAQIERARSDDAELIAGVGDRAYYEPSSTIMAVLVGDTLVNIQSGWVQQGDAARDVLTDIGKIVAARLRTGSVPPELEITPPPVVTAASACDLLSADALAGILEQGSVTRTGSADLPQFCTYTIDSTGAVGLSVRLQKTGGLAGWDATVSGAQAISGIGDKAAWAEFDQSLYVLKNDSVIQLGVVGLGLDSGAALALAKQIASVAVPNL